MEIKSRMVAILLCFFFGWLGIHKFYLNNNKIGCFYLAFCWTLIPAIISIFDIIILLIMSDQTFNQKFNSNIK
jgi:TM2 domain-containing membrane protein YozV